MLFLYRPRETWMPFALPRNRTQQAAYNRQLQQKFDSTRRVAPSPPVTPAPIQRDIIAELNEAAALHRSGVLTDAEFAQAKARLLER